MKGDVPHQRMTPLPAEEWGDAEYDAFGTMLGIPGEKVPRAGSGHRLDPTNFTVVALLARNPSLARAFLGFSDHLLRRSTLPVRWRELAILRVVHRRRCAYGWGEHVRLALAAGVTQDEIDSLAGDNVGFAGMDLAVLDAADQLLVDGRISDATWQALQAGLETHQLMDLVFVVGAWTMLAMAFEMWGLPPQPDMARLPDPAH